MLLEGTIRFKMKPTSGFWSWFSESEIDQIAVREEVKLPCPWSFPGHQIRCHLDSGKIVVELWFHGVGFLQNLPIGLNRAGSAKCVFNPPAGYAYVAIDDVDLTPHPTFAEAKDFARWILKQFPQK